MKQVLTVVGVLAGLGVAAGVVWGLVVDTPLLTRDTTGIVTAGPELAKQIDSDAWFAVLGLVIGVPSGILVALRRGLDPVVGVLTVVLGALVASVLCLAVGHLVGPGDPVEVLRDAAPGATAPSPLTIHTWVVLALWPLAAALGALVALLLKPPRLQDPDHPSFRSRSRREPEAFTSHKADKAPS